jgi:hypothetical protein
MLRSRGVGGGSGGYVYAQFDGPLENTFPCCIADLQLAGGAGISARSGVVEGDRSRRGGEVPVAETADVLSAIAVRELGHVLLDHPVDHGDLRMSNPRSASSCTAPPGSTSARRL